MYVPSISRRFDGIAPHEGTESPPSVEATRFKRTVSMGLPRMRGLKVASRYDTVTRSHSFDGIAPHEGTESYQSLAYQVRVDLFRWDCPA